MDLFSILSDDAHLKQHFDSKFAAAISDYMNRIGLRRPKEESLKHLVVVAFDAINPSDTPQYFAQLESFLDHNFAQNEDFNCGLLKHSISALAASKTSTSIRKSAFDLIFKVNSYYGDAYENLFKSIIKHTWLENLQGYQDLLKFSLNLDPALLTIATSKYDPTYSKDLNSISEMILLARKVINLEHSKELESVINTIIAPFYYHILLSPSIDDKIRESLLNSPYLIIDEISEARSIAKNTSLQIDHFRFADSTLTHQLLEQALEKGFLTQSTLSFLLPFIFQGASDKLHETIKYLGDKLLHSDLLLGVKYMQELCESGYNMISGTHSESTPYIPQYTCPIESLSKTINESTNSVYGYIEGAIFFARDIIFTNTHSCYEADQCVL